MFSVLGGSVMKQHKHTVRSVKKATAPRVSGTHMILIFLLGSVIGFVLEGVWSLLRLGVWENHSATVIGPFCIVYGFGAVTVYWLAARLRDRRAIPQFLIYSAAGTLVELLASLFQEAAFGSVSWDYSEHALNVGGRISLQMTLIWGVLGLLFSKFCYPSLHRLLEHVKGTRWRIVGALLALLTVLDLLLTAAALWRWREREQEPIPSNFVEELLDRYCSDDFMRQIFSNMSFTD